MPNQDNNDKKLQYLKRDEVRTMEKDVNRLRETEAEAERGRVAKLKTEQELGEERQKTERAEIEAKQREAAEAEVRKKEGDLIRLMESGGVKEAQLLKREAGEKEFRKDEFREQLKEVQQTEEEQRRVFLERVEAKAEGREPSPPPETTPLAPEIQPEITLEPPPETPSRPPFKFPKIPLPSFTGYFPSGPSLLGKLWVKILISLLTLVILLAVGTFWYWYLIVKKETAVAPQPVPQVVKVETLPITKMILDQGYRIPGEPRVIDTIIIHSVFNAIEGDPYSAGGIIKEYQLNKVAAHYLIDREGRIYQTAPLEAMAYHAGKSQMPDGRTDVNNFSIGIELIYRDSESPNEAQYQALAKLIKYLRQDYEIPDKNILGHRDVSPAAKTDPWNFDWGKVVDKLPLDNTSGL
jgi:hypothetical protein